MSNRMLLPQNNRAEFLEFVRELGAWLLSVVDKLPGYGDWKWDNLGVDKRKRLVMLDLASLCAADTRRFTIPVSGERLAEGDGFADWNLPSKEDRKIATEVPGVGGLVLDVWAESATCTLKILNGFLCNPDLPGFAVRRVKLYAQRPVTKAQQDAIDALEQEWNAKIRKASRAYERQAIGMILLDLLVNCGREIFAKSRQDLATFLAGDICYTATPEKASSRLRALLADVEDLKSTNPELWGMLDAVRDGCGVGDAVVSTPTQNPTCLPGASHPRDRSLAPEPKRCKRDKVPPSLECPETLSPTI